MCSVGSLLLVQHYPLEDLEKVKDLYELLKKFITVKDAQPTFHVDHCLIMDY